MMGVIRRQCEAICECGNWDNDQQCSWPSDGERGGRWLCWVHLRAVDNPDRVDAVRFIVRAEDVAAGVDS